MDILILIGKTIVFYFFLIIVIRIMGKREVGNLSIFDLAVYFTISDLITMSIVDKKNPIYLPAISVAILVLLQVFLSHVSLRNKKIRDLLDGKKSITHALLRIAHSGAAHFCAAPPPIRGTTFKLRSLQSVRFPLPRRLFWPAGTCRALSAAYNSPRRAWT